MSDREIRDTMKFLLTRMKIVVEPSGAATAAALYHRKLPKGLNRVGAILSGGNVDLELLQTLGIDAAVVMKAWYSACTFVLAGTQR